MDKKLTDNEIIKALECCLCDNSECLQCQNKELCRIECDELATKTIDLITRQQTENENLKVENQSLRTAANSLKMHYEEAQAEIESLEIFRGYAEKRANDYKTMRDKYLNAKSEAYKEFSEKLKEFMHNKFKALDEYEFEHITERDIDNIVKERAGDDND